MSKSLWGKNADRINMNQNRNTLLTLHQLLAWKYITDPSTQMCLTTQVCSFCRICSNKQARGLFSVRGQPETKTQKSEAKQVQRDAKTHYIMQKCCQKKWKITTRRCKMTVNGHPPVPLLRFWERLGTPYVPMPQGPFQSSFSTSVTDINTFQHDKWPWKWISAVSSTSLEPFPQALAFITVRFPQFYFGHLCLCPWCKEKRWISAQDEQHRPALAEIQPHPHNLHPTWRICQPSMLHVLP